MSFAATHSAVCYLINLTEFFNFQIWISTCSDDTFIYYFHFSTCFQSLKNILTTCQFFFQAQDNLMHELRSHRFFDVFEYNGPRKIWGCFLCNHPDRAVDFVQVCEMFTCDVKTLWTLIVKLKIWFQVTTHFLGFLKTVLSQLSTAWKFAGSKYYWPWKQVFMITR